MRLRSRALILIRPSLEHAISNGRDLVFLKSTYTDQDNSRLGWSADMTDPRMADIVGG
jgi:hypothetical protein